MINEQKERELKCLDILQNSGQPERVINHCKAVASIAKGLAEKLNEKGYELDVALCYRAGLLHDICRTEKKHAAKGRALLEEMGLSSEAKIVGTHMGEGLNTDEISESSVVFLADKLVAGGERVDVKARYAPAFVRFADDEEIIALVKKRSAAALRLEAFVEQILGDSLQNIPLD